MRYLRFMEGFINTDGQLLVNTNILNPSDVHTVFTPIREIGWRTID